jgi:hypothetical protein
MAENQGGGTSREFVPGGPGETAGGDANTIDRARGTAGPRGEDLSQGELTAQRLTADVPGHADESTSAADDKRLHDRLPELDASELSRLSVLETGTALEQGGTYLDLNDRPRGPFKAIGGQEAGPTNRYVAKRDTDYELWNRLVGDRETQLERPDVG